MGNVTVNISFQGSLLRDIDRVARTESRSRSEFLREAARAYIRRRERWTGIFAIGQKVAREKGITPDDVAQEIRDHRRAKVPRK